jgi:hypothetical protein
MLQPGKMQEVAQEILQKKKRKIENEMAMRCRERPEEDEDKRMDREDEE